MLSLLICLVATKPAFAHEFNFGFFEIFREHTKLYVEIRLDEDKLALALEKQFKLEARDGFNEQWECFISDYLQANFSLEIGDQQAELMLLNFETDQNMVIVLGEVLNPPDHIQRINVVNTTLLEIADNQTNIIRSSLYEKSRSFRLNKERISTSIKY